MKSVGQQLQEARLARNWTPELAARETKIKADRVRDLEADDYTHFSSPTYARGFVRTYARALGLDEYRILRQLDNKLPEDDNATFAPDGGMPYVPETSSQAMHVSSAPRTGLYVVFGLGCAVVLIIAFVLLQAYRAGELPRYFASTAATDTTTNAPATATAPVADTESPPHALPVDPNDTSHSPKAMPVDLNAVATAPADTNAAPASTNAVVAVAPVATPATPAPGSESTTTNSAPSVAVADAPITIPSSTNAAVPVAATPVAADQASAPVAPPAEPTVVTTSSARASNTSIQTVAEKPAPRALPVDPRDLVAYNETPPDATAIPVAAPVAPDATAPEATTAVDLGNGTGTPAPAFVDPKSGKRLVLTASRDSFIRVTSLDAEDKPVLYASVLRSGQSLAFDGHKFSVNVGVPSAVDIVLDGVNYGPHSDREEPETFTLESHQR